MRIFSVAHVHRLGGDKHCYSTLKSADSQPHPRFQLLLKDLSVVQFLFSGKPSWGFCQSSYPGQNPTARKAVSLSLLSLLVSEGSEKKKSRDFLPKFGNGGDSSPGRAVATPADGGLSRTVRLLFTPGRAALSPPSNTIGGKSPSFRYYCLSELTLILFYLVLDHKRAVRRGRLGARADHHHQRFTKLSYPFFFSYLT